MNRQVLLLITFVCCLFSTSAFSDTTDSDSTPKAKLPDDPKLRLAYLEGFYSGVTDALDEERENISTISTFVPRTPSERVLTAGYIDGHALALKAVGDAKAQVIEAFVPGSAKRRRAFLDKLRNNHNDSKSDTTKEKN